MVFIGLDDIADYKKDFDRQNSMRKKLADQLGISGFCRCIDSTELRPLGQSYQRDIETLSSKAKEDGMNICTDGARIKRARDIVGDAPIRIAAVIGFPWGTAGEDAKRAEIRAYAKLADEYDAVANAGLLLSGSMHSYASEIKSMAISSSRLDKPLKVIISTYAMDHRQIVEISGMVREIGKDCGCEIGVKNSQGFPVMGYSKTDVSARMEDVWLMRVGVGEYEKDNMVMVKAAGGISDLDTALDFMLAAGAIDNKGRLAVPKKSIDSYIRIGSSSASKLAEQFRSRYAA